MGPTTSFIFAASAALLICGIQGQVQYCPAAPIEASDIGKSCVGPKSCNYDPFSCGPNDYESEIIMRTTCACSQDTPGDGLFSWSCNFADVVCPDPEDGDVTACPDSPPFGEECDSSGGEFSCGYNILHCPFWPSGSFIENCQCFDNFYNCFSLSVRPCDVEEPLLADLAIANAQTPAPTGAPASTGFGGACFSGDVLVEVQDRGTVSMKNLQIGDMVKTSSYGQAHRGYSFEPVYSFGHYAPNTVEHFLQLHVMGDTAPLQITADHLLAIKYIGFVPASTVMVGDILVGGFDDHELVVVAIKTVKARGLFAPFTPSGTIVVNGVVASSFVTLQPNTSTLLSLIGGRFELSHQWIAHTFEFPHRVACHYMGSCPREEYDEHGISVWVSTPLKMARWLLDQGIVLRNLVLMGFVLVLFALHILEASLLNPITFVFLLTVALCSKNMAIRFHAKTIKAKSL
mmetsp:Transcript_3389/g.5574  ORF Transcript_3389/g.5574 Transcript_3389/m.5574 type:complete len:459 (+) Transcript_3389:75-1451(+)|eukprot:CAMPEP_0119015552 /NCGR_PEP_ID=MMETSP1176-20130426/11218_1 /TAXON_ID=265551 /ORGANISM="Synedropsis recta cf, Strain CCMP1620" /LENGTH=458 /DNA_ID=CAMNT_0006968857 /DNA_START=53 /DNA_END=1429 /DNA_ORIENTATION=+